MPDKGEKMQSAGKQMESAGWTLTKLGCSGFILLVIVAIVVGVASSHSSSKTSESTAENTTSSEESTTPENTSTEAHSAEHAISRANQAKHCDEELTANSNTSCAFAKEVQSAFTEGFDEHEEAPSTVSAYSPVTQKTYSLKCSIINHSSYAECISGSAAVVFSFSKIELAALERKEAQEESEYGEDRVGSSSHVSDAKFCQEHECIGNFTSEEGTIVECSDGTYSHAGGIQGACSDHGGER